jgi:Flp pilus assembly protein TadG
LRGSSLKSTDGKGPQLSIDPKGSTTAGGLSPVRRRRRFRARVTREECGQSVVEFGMVVPLLCVVVLVLVDFGKAMNYWIDLTHIANEGARLAAVNADVTQPPYNGAGASTLQQYVQRQAETELKGSTVSVCFPSGNAAGAPVTVQVTYPYSFIPFIGRVWTIKGKATMRLEHGATKFSASGSCT